MPASVRTFVGLLVGIGCGCSDSGSPGEPADLTRQAPPATPVSSALVTEIHSVADLVAGLPADAAKLDLRGPDGRVSEPDTAALTAELSRQIHALGANDGWPDHSTSSVHPQGGTLVVRGTRAYQRTLATYLHGLRGSAAPR